ncbi:MAG TPA: cytidine deaminase [Methylomusa anaerophila]|uniref:Cytidine deaminase n=1 Tax=Methylomusa anaerophila TaxID=1930071 RepID=A0A348ANZ6_9FIRM|nr:cytidine deaminase [Methylomusa anaerophila]BBB92794.1 cytidine deaminase [Methylomusa anaerophila]HML87355.1 cytidine deaminase [Methylomusa anaerophila]
MDKVVKELLEAALLARKKAYAPYSNFKVGAAVLGKNDKIYGGCNIENASFGLSNCAERTAIFKAVSEGEKEIIALAVVANTTEPVSPCGACLQVMSEFGIKRIILGNTQREWRETTIRELLPDSFTKTDLVSGGD